MKIATLIFWFLFYIYTHIIVFDIGNKYNTAKVETIKQLQDELNECRAVKKQQNLTIRQLIVQNYIKE